MAQRFGFSTFRLLPALGLSRCTTEYLKFPLKTPSAYSVGLCLPAAR